MDMDFDVGLTVADFACDNPPMLNAMGYYPAAPEISYCLGLDIGQVTDPSAVSVVKRVRAPIEPADGVDWLAPDLRHRLGEPVYNVVHLWRVKLRMTYPAQFEYV